MNCCGCGRNWIKEWSRFACADRLWLQMVWLKVSWTDLFRESSSAPAWRQTTCTRGGCKQIVKLHHRIITWPLNSLVAVTTSCCSILSRAASALLHHLLFLGVYIVAGQACCLLKLAGECLASEPTFPHRIKGSKYLQPIPHYKEDEEMSFPSFYYPLAISHKVKCGFVAKVWSSYFLGSWILFNQFCLFLFVCLFQNTIPVFPRSLNLASWLHTTKLYTGICTCPIFTCW